MVVIEKWIVLGQFQYHIVLFECVNTFRLTIVLSKLHYIKKRAQK